QEYAAMLKICLPSVETLGYFRAFVVRIGQHSGPSPPVWPSRHFGVHAQVIGHRSITIDDVSYINAALRLPPCQHYNRQVLIWIDANLGRIDNHSGALAVS